MSVHIHTVDIGRNRILLELLEFVIAILPNGHCPENERLLPETSLICFGSRTFLIKKAIVQRFHFLELTKSK